MTITLTKLQEQNTDKISVSGNEYTLSDDFTLNDHVEIQTGDILIVPYGRILKSKKHIGHCRYLN